MTTRGDAPTTARAPECGARARPVRASVRRASSFMPLVASASARAAPAPARVMRSRSRSSARRAPARALDASVVSELAMSENAMLTYGSIGVCAASIAFFAYRAFGSAFIGPSATASHVLVASRARAEALKSEIETAVAGGAPLRATFARAAEKESTCPSAKKGGELGTFRRGQMVREFDDVVFTGDLDTVLGPVDTQFGSHLILVTARAEN